jgi:YidC/Oxa1 family membrane protein insertase
MWDSIVEFVRVTILSVAQMCGGSVGGAVLLVSAGVRLALLPLTLRIARQARAQQGRLATLKPEIEALRKRHAKDPARLWQEVQALYKRHDIRLLQPSAMVSVLVQTPLLGAVFSATRRGLGEKVRFLWVAELARPDALLGLAVSALTALVTAAAMQVGGDKNAMTTAAPAIAAVIGLATLAFLWTASSAVALSVGAGSAVTALQNWILSRDAKAATRA